MPHCQTGPKRFAFLPRLLVTLGFCLSSAFAPSAHATLVGDTVTATLNSPNGLTVDATPILLSDTVTVAAGVEIPAGTGNVGSFMLTGEFIDFQASAISLRAGCGDTNAQGACITGFASGAEYIFSDLNDSLGTITGISLSGISGFLNFDPTWVTLVDANTISVALDTMQFIDTGFGQSNNFGLLTINLIVTPNVEPPVNGVPEPGSLALMLLAGMTLVGASRRNRA